MSTVNEQLDRWLEQLEQNLDTFIKSRVSRKDKRLAFIRTQYNLIQVTDKVITGQARLHGVKPIAKPPVNNG